MTGEGLAGLPTGGKPGGETRWGTSGDPSAGGAQKAAHEGCQRANVKGHCN